MRPETPDATTPLLSISEARRIILENVPVLPAETVTLLSALGRVSAEDVHAPWDIPMSDNSAMDGFAFSSSPASAQLRVTDFVPAGESRESAVPEGEAVRIMTGAPIPLGCDTVAPLEEVLVEGETIRLRKTSRPGDNIRLRGEDVRKEDLVIASGTLLRPPEIAMQVSLGRTTALVHRKVRVAVLSTGDELLDAGSALVPGKFINSNSWSLAAQIMAAGGEPLVLGVARDDPGETRRRIVEGLRADCLITTGGVSVGDRDFVKDVIVEMGGEIKFWRVAVKPGKPMAFALVDGRPVFSLPGNPVPVFVSFEEFIRPALLRMMGHRRLFRPTVKALLEEAVTNRGKRTHLVRGTVRLDGGRYHVATTGNQSSGRISSMLRSNGLIIIPPGADLRAGDEVDVRIFDREFENAGSEGILSPT